MHKVCPYVCARRIRMPHAMPLDVISTHSAYSNGRRSITSWEASGKDAMMMAMASGLF